jgi:predicted RNA-binding protein (virulence factor B family)
MVRLGDYNTLKVVKRVDFGLYLDGGDDGEILMPQRYVNDDIAIGDEVRVFIYLDSEDRLVATTETPKAKVGEFAYLQVSAVNRFGAFLDWGLAKDLMVPFREQKVKMEQGQWHLIFVYIDLDTDRIAASAKLDQFLDNVAPEYKEGDEVEIMVAARTDLGYKVIINNLHWGIVYSNEVFKTLNRGEKLTAYIKKVREDDKIDVTLQKPGFARVDSLQDMILDKIRNAGGFLPVNDKTEAQVIYDMFGCSKKSFKMTIGTLFKQRKIVIGNDGISLV